MQTNHYGLVPGTILKSFDVYKGGTKAGFEPAVAQRLVQAGYFRPDSAENVASAEAKATADGVEQAGETEVFLVALESGTLQVPQNWREQHHTKKKAWAAQIKGENVASVAEADAVIAEAVKEQEAALNPQT